MKLRINLQVLNMINKVSENTEQRKWRHEVIKEMIYEIFPKRHGSPDQKEPPSAQHDK